MTDSFSLPTNENPNFDEVPGPHVRRGMTSSPASFSMAHPPRAARILLQGFFPCA